MGSSVSSAPSAKAEFADTADTAHTNGTTTSGEQPASPSASADNCALLGRWTAVQWTGSARAGGDPDPFDDEKTVIITAESVVFPKGTSFTGWSMTNTQSGQFTTFDQETISMNVEGDRLTVAFGYRNPATITYERDNSRATFINVPKGHVQSDPLPSVPAIPASASKAGIPKGRKQSLLRRLWVPIILLLMACMIYRVIYLVKSQFFGAATREHDPMYHTWCGVGDEQAYWVYDNTTSTSKPCDYRCGDEYVMSHLEKANSPLLGRWTAVDSWGHAANGGDPDPFHDEKVVIVSENEVNFPGGTQFYGWTLNDMVSGQLTTYDDEVIEFQVEGEELFVWFGYREPATIVYHRDSSGGDMNKADSPLLGRWTAVEWTESAYNGGDPDPIHDERVVVISEDAVDFIDGTMFDEWTLTDMQSGSLTAGRRETITLHVQGELLSIWFGYEKPATIVYQRQELEY